MANQFERAMGICKSAINGMRVFNHVAGNRSSSSRAELAGAIAAITRRVPRRVVVRRLTAVFVVLAARFIFTA